MLSFLPAYATVRTVTLRTAGNDFLTYESFARSILEQRSIKGGEAVFYYQPLFRYVRFLEHLLLGDGDLLIVATAFAGLTFAILWMLRRFRVRGSWLSMAVCTGTGVLMLMVAVSPVGASQFLTLGASEYPTWIMLPLALPLLFVSRSRRAGLCGTGLMALSALTRLNQGPAVLAIFGAFLLRIRRRWRLAVAACALFVAIGLLPLAHNVHYGGRLVLFPTSGDIPQNLVLRPSRVLAAASDAAARATVADQVRWMFAWRQMPDGILLLPALYGLQVMWIGAVVWALASRRMTLPSLILAATPAIYLGVHLFYQVSVYYPRHILIAHLMMGAVAAILSRPSGAFQRTAVEKHSPAELNPLI